MLPFTLEEEEDAAAEDDCLLWWLEDLRILALEEEEP
jgi:hypothetical protein